MSDCLKAYNRLLRQRANLASGESPGGYGYLWDSQGLHFLGDGGSAF